MVESDAVVAAAGVADAAAVEDVRIGRDDAVGARAGVAGLGARRVQYAGRWVETMPLFAELLPVWVPAARSVR